MSNPYVSSIVSNYGDVDMVREDVKTLNEILGRQGNQLLIDVIAESIGETSNKFKLTEVERNRIFKATVSSLENALSERV